MNNKDTDNIIEKLSSTKKYIVYTDGGCRGNPGLGSYYFIILNGNNEPLYENGELFRDTTNNRMEIMAILRALEIIFSVNKGKDISITIYSDSMYCINALTRWIKEWKNRKWKNVKNMDLWKSIDNIIDDRYSYISFEHVRGHSGNKWNEYVDGKVNEIMDNY